MASAASARARAAADRLAACGVREPVWSSGVGAGRAVAAALQCDEAFDDGVSVIVEFDGYGEEPHTLGIYIDHNLGGLVRGVFLAGSLSDVRAKLSVRAPNGVQFAVRDLELAEARARIVAALDVLDHTYETALFVRHQQSEGRASVAASPLQRPPAAATLRCCNRR